MKLKHIISSKQINRTILEDLFKLTDKVKKGNYNKKALTGKIMATLFYQPSTRTRLSFESAMLRLGGETISTENASEFSSAIKGETLEDTIRIVNFYSDVIVIRHPESGAAELASNYSKIPVINGGDGVGEHPTQALMDLYTIFSKFKTKNLHISIAGDHAHYRPTHSLSYLLGLYPQISITYISPKTLSLPKELKNYLKQQNIRYTETEDFKKGISQADVVYQTRIPKEYLGSDYKKYLGRYVLDKKSISYVKKDAIILHPLPRVNELSKDIDNDKRALYFEEAQNGLYIRMALLLYLFDKQNPITG